MNEGMKARARDYIKNVHDVLADKRNTVDNIRIGEESKVSAFNAAGELPQEVEYSKMYLGKKKTLEELELEVNDWTTKTNDSINSSAIPDNKVLLKAIHKESIALTNKLEEFKAHDISK